MGSIKEAELSTRAVPADPCCHPEKKTRIVSDPSDPIIAVAKTSLVGVSIDQSKKLPIIESLEHRKIDHIRYRNFLIILTVFVFTALITVPLLISVCRQIDRTEENLSLAKSLKEDLTLEDQYYLSKNFLVQKRDIELRINNQNLRKESGENTAQFLYRVTKTLKQTGLVFDAYTTEIVANHFAKEFLSSNEEKILNSYHFDDSWLMYLTEMRLSNPDLQRDCSLHGLALDLSDIEMHRGKALIQGFEQRCIEHREQQCGDFIEFMQQSLGVADEPGREIFKREMKKNFSGHSYWNAVLEGRVERRLKADLHGQWHPRL